VISVSFDISLTYLACDTSVFYRSPLSEVTRLLSRSEVTQFPCLVRHPRLLSRSPLSDVTQVSCLGLRCLQCRSPLSEVTQVSCLSRDTRLLSRSPSSLVYASVGSFVGFSFASFDMTMSTGASGVA